MSQPPEDAFAEQIAAILRDAFAGRVQDQPRTVETVVPAVTIAEVAARLQLDAAREGSLEAGDARALQALSAMRERPFAVAPDAARRRRLSGANWHFSLAAIWCSLRRGRDFSTHGTSANRASRGAKPKNAMSDAANSFAPLIERLYHDAGASPVTMERPVVPLRRLLAGQEVNQRELPLLTSRAALHFLLGRGAIVEVWPGTSSQSLAGFLYANSGGACVFVRAEDPVSRRRFCAAHELGHFVLHFPMVMEAARAQNRAGIELIEILPPCAPDADEISGGHLTIHEPGAVHDWELPREQLEHEADAFAAELLMPESVVRALVERNRSHSSDFDLIWRLSTEMLVSRAAMKVRLRHLGLLRGEASLLN